MNVSKTAAIEPESRVVIAPGYRLQWETSQDSHVLLYPEGMVRLNPSGAEILARCTGERTVAELITDLEQAFPGVELEADVYEFLEVAHARSWIRKR